MEVSSLRKEDGSAWSKCEFVMVMIREDFGAILDVDKAGCVSVELNIPQVLIKALVKDYRVSVLPEYCHVFHREKRLRYDQDPGLRVLKNRLHFSIGYGGVVWITLIIYPLRTFLPLIEQFQTRFPQNLPTG